MKVVLKNSWNMFYWVWKMLLDNVKCVPQVGFFGIQILNNNKQQQHHSVFYWSDALPVAQTTPSKY